MKKPYGIMVKDLPYPVVNERGVRAAAGIMFALGIITFMTVFITRNYLFLYLLVPLFWADFLLKSVFQPRFSFFGQLGDWLVKQQKPEYVGAIQKRFAWGLGLMMSSVMMIFALLLGARGALPFSICILCLVFMWMESVLGICVGCSIYQYLLKKGILTRPVVQPACPGGACSLQK